MNKTSRRKIWEKEKCEKNGCCVVSVLVFVHSPFAAAEVSKRRGEEGRGEEEAEEEDDGMTEVNFQLSHKSERTSRSVGHCMNLGGGACLL